MPSVSRRATTSAAATSFATIARRTGSATCVQQNLPTLDRDRLEHAVRPPGIRRKPLAEVFLGFRGHDMHCVALVLERASEHDDALVDERVYERGMLVPAVLLAHSTAPVPRPSALEPEDEVLHLYCSPIICSARSRSPGRTRISREPLMAPLPPMLPAPESVGRCIDSMPSNLSSDRTWSASISFRT